MALEVNSVPLSLVPDLIRDHLGLAAAGHECLELARYPQSAERCVGNQCQALPGAVIDHGQGECRNFRVRGAIEHYAAMARMKRSPKMTANCALAMDHSRGGIFHSFCDRFKIR